MTIMVLALRDKASFGFGAVPPMAASPRPWLDADDLPSTVARASVPVTSRRQRLDFRLETGPTSWGGGSAASLNVARPHSIVDLRDWGRGMRARLAIGLATVSGAGGARPRSK